MRRGLWFSLIGIVVLAIGSLILVTLSSSKPALGLDLRGGVSVVLAPDRKVDSGQLNQAVNIIRSRVDALGVAEPDINTQGNDIVISLPGVKDPDNALQLVGQTAELRFRPVLGTLPPYKPAGTPATTVPGAPSTTTTTANDGSSTPNTSRADDTPEATVVLPEVTTKNSTGVRYVLGPSYATGNVVKSATATPPQVAGNWTVDLTFTGNGGSQFLDASKKCVAKDSTCPNGALAIVLDGVVQSAPTIQPDLVSNFNNSAQITGSFTQKQAQNLATVLRFGSLPVQLTPQSTQTVSATLGKDSLRAGVIAGIVGLALVLFYMLIYYRALGLVVVLGLGISGALLWSIVAWLGASRGLALSLAGATGIIVSVGVTVDSYVVYFERLKDEIRSGKTIRSSVDRGFSRAFRTILAADLVSFMAAALLYWLTVGPVRGFAFFLGLSTALDVVTAYFFTRPVVTLLGRSRFFTDAPFFGVARGLAAAGAAR
jgi:preprotein translocase subunit SecD